MATPVYTVRRPASCDTAAIQAVLTQLATEGFKVIAVIPHSTDSGPWHNGRFCAIDIIGEK